MSNRQTTESGPAKAQWFSTTQWSVILAAGQGPSRQADAALEQLCRTYWYPLYAYIRRRGHSPEDAQDLTQEFFARLLEKNFLETVQPEKGKFRSFLLAALNHFLSNQRDRAQALKRGGQQTFVPLDPETAEERYRLEAPASLTPAMVFERRWALAVLDQSFQRLRLEFANTDRAEHFERLKGFLEGEVGRGDYQVAAAELKVSPAAVAMAVHRLRQRYQELVRSEVANTVTHPGDIEAEMRHLFAVLAQ